ncbi:hypothetical protein CR513_48514, partial [Mucuna pruriens]
MSESDVSIPNNSIEDVTDDMPIALRKGKQSCVKLKKALYGLKQTPRAWFGRFAQVMISLGYRQSQGDDEIEKLTLKEKLATQFEIKELGKKQNFEPWHKVYVTS